MTKPALEALVVQIEATIDRGDFDQAQQLIEAAERNLGRPPQLAELRQRLDARAKEAVRRQLSREVDQAGKDVERLIGGDELSRASQALASHVDRLGRHEVFDELARRLDRAKAELRVRKRLEWTGRRRKEAEGLVRQAGRLSLRGEYEAAIERLGAARELDPDHPEIDGMLQAAHKAQRRELDERRRSEALRTAAYSWEQVSLFPFRGAAAAFFWSLLGSMVALEALDALPWVGGLLAGIRWLLPIVALGLLFETVRETWRGSNSFPPWSRLLDGRRWALDCAGLLAVAAVAAAPLAVLVATRGLHGLFAGASGWWAAALLTWLAAALAVATAAAAGAFGRRQLPRIARHVHALRAGGPDTLIAVNLVFAVVVAVVILRATFVPYVPWLGSPLAGALEAWAVLAVPHLIGVVARRHRVELTRIYR